MANEVADRVIGFIATSIACVLVLRLSSYVKVVWHQKPRGGSHKDGGEEGDGKEEENEESSSEQRWRDGSRRRPRPSARPPTGEGEEDAYHSYVYGSKAGKVVHKGCCHCQRLTFNVEAPAHLAAMEGPGKLRFPFIRVPSAAFHLTSDDSDGAHYVLTHKGEASIFFFCSSCGAHVVQTTGLAALVNTNLLDTSTIDSLTVAFVDSGLYPGVGQPCSHAGSVADMHLPKNGISSSSSNSSSSQVALVNSSRRFTDTALHVGAQGRDGMSSGEWAKVLTHAMAEK